MKKKTTFQITWDKKDGILRVSYFDKISDARKFIERNFHFILSCWRNIDYKHKSHKSSTERIFRNLSENEPKDYWNNNIKAKIKCPNF